MSVHFYYPTIHDPDVVILFTDNAVQIVKHYRVASSLLYGCVIMITAFNQYFFED